MERRLSDPRLRFLKGDVRDYDRLHEAMDGVDIVVHAAALKRVEGSEQDASEAVKTNTIGAMNVVRAAVERRVERVMGLSSDKACGPVTLYGATKLAMERLFVATHGTSRTQFACVRYGNVVASAGSVVPLFLEQRPSGRLTVTDERATRFWVTLGQAVRWIKRRIELMEPRCIYVPILPSAKVMDIARAVASECRVETVGMRGIEKLHEQMIDFDESRHARRVEDLGTLSHFVIDPSLGPGPEFRYTSDRNTQWLDVSQIRAALPGALAEAGLVS